MKSCTACRRELPLEDFHKKKEGIQGRDPRCKVCKQKAQRSQWPARRKKHLAKLSEYSRRWHKTEKGRQSQAEATSRMREKYPEKYTARVKLRNAVALGKLEKLPCEVCGEEKSHGHHDDYSRPLEVRWLCARHHKKLHSIYPEEREKVTNLLQGGTRS